LFSASSLSFLRGMLSGKPGYRSAYVFWFHAFCLHSELGMSNKLELDSLDSAKYLYLRELSEPRDNSLRLVVQEAVVNPIGSVRFSHSELPELEEILKGSAPIESTDACRTFELTWKHYVAYLVTEECVGSGGQDADEIHTGKLCRVYTKSHFLEHLSRDTGGHTEAILHYKLICLNHLIDVAAYAPPDVKQTWPVSSTQARIQ
jgi:hypothetical protein